jgi:hypothetical protein
VTPLLPRGRRSRHTLPIPDRPYRDTAILHGVLAAILFGVAALTGTSLAKSALVAVGYFVAATAWSWWRFSVRIRASRATAAATTSDATRPDAEGPP